MSVNLDAACRENGAAAITKETETAQAEIAVAEAFRDQACAPGPLLSYWLARLVRGRPEPA